MRANSWLSMTSTISLGPHIAGEYVQTASMRCWPMTSLTISSYR